MTNYHISKSSKIFLQTAIDIFLSTWTKLNWIDLEWNKLNPNDLTLIKLAECKQAEVKWKEVNYIQANRKYLCLLITESSDI